jgi:hypothetical protein
MDSGGNVALRRSILLLAVLAAIILGWLGWRRYSSAHTAQTSAPIIIKEPVNFTSHSFDPARPPAAMPPLAPGEEAECDANFLSKANVAGESRPTDATHAAVTITQIKIMLQLNINIWAPIGATQHVIDHEEGHRQIAERYYETADKVAGRVAAAYLGRKIQITGANLDEELNKALQQMSTEITAEYNKELNPGPAQERFDSLTDHARNDMTAASAVTQALSENPPD